MNRANGILLGEGCLGKNIHVMDRQALFIYFLYSQALHALSASPDTLARVLDVFACMYLLTFRCRVLFYFSHTLGPLPPHCWMRSLARVLIVSAVSFCG